MRGAGVLTGDIGNRLGGGSFSRPLGTPGRNFRDDVSHTTFGELQGILEKERAKYKDSKDKLENDLDHERKARIEFQNKLIKLKDEFSRRDIELSEFEFRENNILHQVQDYQIENQKLKTQLLRMQQLYGNRVFQLQNQLSSEKKQNQETLHEYKSQFQKFKKEGLQYIDSLNFQHDRKVKGLEDKAKGLEMGRRQLTMESKKLNDMLIQNKILFEEELRETTNRLREDEVRKGQFMVKSFEQKMKSTEDAKEALTRRIQDLSRQMQDKDRQLQELESQKNDELQKLRLDNSDLGGKYSQIAFLFEKAKAQLQQKDAVLNRNSGETSHQVGYLKQQVEQKRKEIDMLNATIRQLRQNTKDMAGEFQRKRSQIAEKCAFYQSQARRHKQQNTRIYETLKAKINETIINVNVANKR